MCLWEFLSNLLPFRFVLTFISSVVIVFGSFIRIFLTTMGLCVCYIMNRFQCLYLSCGVQTIIKGCLLVDTNTTLDVRMVRKCFPKCETYATSLARKIQEFSLVFFDYIFRPYPIIFSLRLLMGIIITTSSPVPSKRF